MQSFARNDFSQDFPRPTDRPVALLSATPSKTQAPTNVKTKNPWRVAILVNMLTAIACTQNEGSLNKFPSESLCVHHQTARTAEANNKFKDAVIARRQAAKAVATTFQLYLFDLKIGHEFKYEKMYGDCPECNLIMDRLLDKFTEAEALQAFASD